MTTITASTTVGIDLNPASIASPVIIDAGVTVSNPGYAYAVYRHPGASTLFIIDNSGTITSGSGIGVYLSPGGAVTNAAGASVVGATAGINVAGGLGTIFNDGGIAATGTRGVGVELTSGGSVANAATGTITAYYGVDILGNPGTVVNYGAVAGTIGVELAAGGMVTNAANGGISSVRIGGDGSLVNDGGIGNASFFAGGSVTNTGTIADLQGIIITGGTGAVTNGGLIEGLDTGSGGAVVLGSNGAVTNTGTIRGARGVVIAGNGTVSNQGLIAGTHGWAITLASGGTVTNAVSARITGGFAIRITGGLGSVGNAGYVGEPVLLAAGGSVTNAASAAINTGHSYALEIGTTPGTVVNDGLISGGTGISLNAGGSVANLVSGRIDGLVAISISGGVGAVTNDGYLSNMVQFTVGGSVTNAANASIVNGVDISGGTGDVTNSGSIGGVGLVPGIGIYLHVGGTIANTVGASVVGFNAIRIAGDLGALINAGEVDATAKSGVYLFAGGSVTNTASGTISGSSYGADLPAGGTLINGGTIIGGGGTAVAFGGTGSNRLVLDPGFAFSGSVSGSASASNALELGSAASIGTLAGLGTDVVHFGSIAFDPGAQWFVAGIQRGLAGPISGLATGDTIELTGVTATGSSFVSGVLTLDLAGGDMATLDLPGTFTSASDFAVTNVTAGADVTVACFAAGTCILTDTGEVSVEELTIGDRLATTAGHLAHIVWLGHQRAVVQSVRIRAGAFSEHMPARDLLLSPDHAVFIDGALVPVRHLINGSTIIQEPVDEATYYHVELETHDVILAEGLACESYLDTGNRGAFEDGEAAAHRVYRVTGA